MAAATMIPDLSGTGIQAELRPVWIQGASKKQNHLVHPMYLARAHTAPEMAAVVTQNGDAIVQGGETLTVGLVPPWRRYAIGPVVNGRAELFPQPEFERLEERIYLDTFRFLGASPDDHAKRPIPNVRTFVSWKIDPMNAGRICPLGTYTAPQKAIIAPVAYDALNDRMVDRQSNAALEAAEAALAEKDARLTALEAKMAKLTGTKTAAKVAPARATAKCGKDIDARYMSRHVQMCKKGCTDGSQES